MNASWDSLSLRRCTQLLAGGTPAADEDNWNGDVPFVTPPDLRPVVGGIISATERTISRAAAEAGSTLVPEGSVLLSTRAPIGYVAITDREVAFSQGCRALIPRASLDAQFLVYTLLARGDELQSLGRGTTFIELSGGVLADVSVLVPPVEEQRAIADFLDRETAQIDELITEQQRLIALLRERRSAVVADTFSKGDSEWKQLRLKHLVLDLRQGWSPQCYSWPADGVENWAVLKAGCVNQGTFSSGDNKELPAEEMPRPELTVREGELIVSRANTRELVGSAAVVTGQFPRLMLSDKLYSLRLNCECVLPEFVSLWLGTPHLRDLIQLEATGSSPSMQNVSQADILNLPVILPSLEVQRRMTNKIDRETAKIDALIFETERFIELSRERRAALITAAVTGQIDVRNMSATPQEPATTTA